MTDWNRFDLAISLFGLHWMEPIENSASCIHRSLKPQGKLLYTYAIKKISKHEKCALFATKVFQHKEIFKLY